MAEITAFGRWLKARMDEAGIYNQADLARRMDVANSNVTNWVRGYSEPNVGYVATLARVLGVSVASVYEGLGRMTPIDDADYRYLAELLQSARPDSREQILEYARFVVGRSRGSGDRLGAVEASAQLVSL